MKTLLHFFIITIFFSIVSCNSTNESVEVEHNIEVNLSDGINRDTAVYKKVDTAVYNNNDSVLKTKKVGLQGVEVVADGVFDCSNALQKAIDHSIKNNLDLVIPEGTFLVTEPIYIAGKLNIIGQGDSSIIKVRLNKRSWASFAFGAKKGDPKFSDNVVWSGTVEKLVFDCGSHQNNGMTINVFRADGYVFRDIRVYNHFYAAFKGVNNKDFALGKYVRKNGTYENITIVGDGVNSKEAISVSSISNVGYTEENFIVRNCTISNLVDDCIAFHGYCKNIKIHNNSVENTGRIYISHAREVHIYDNEIKNPSEGTWFVHIGDESSKHSLTSKNVHVTNNKFIADKNAGKPNSYFLRCRGVDNIFIKKNKFLNYQKEKELICAIEVQDDMFFNGERFKSNNIFIENNTIENGFIYSGGSENEGTEISNNKLTGYILSNNQNIKLINNQIKAHPSFPVLYRNQAKSNILNDSIVLYLTKNKKYEELTFDKRTQVLGVKLDGNQIEGDKLLIEIEDENSALKFSFKKHRMKKGVFYIPDKKNKMVQGNVIFKVDDLKDDINLGVKVVVYLASEYK